MNVKAFQVDAMQIFRLEAEENKSNIILVITDRGYSYVGTGPDLLLRSGDRYASKGNPMSATAALGSLLLPPEIWALQNPLSSPSTRFIKSRWFVHT